MAVERYDLECKDYDDYMMVLDDRGDYVLYTTYREDTSNLERRLQEAESEVAYWKSKVAS